MNPRWPRLGLTGKVVFLLLVVTAVPIVVSAVFIGEIARVAQNVADGEVERLRLPLERAAEAYRLAISAQKTAFRQAAMSIALNGALRSGCADGAQVMPAFGTLMDEHAALSRIELLDAHGSSLGAKERDMRQPVRRWAITQPLSGTTCQVVLTFAVSAKLFEEQAELGEVLGASRARAKVRRTLPDSYRNAFVAVVAIVMLATFGVAILVARRATRRIGRLALATQRVRKGDLDVQVSPSLPSARGGDEIDALAVNFDEMVVKLRKSRAEIEYLQKIGAWQEVARRLAHEIKNPLTPIQLAVQQLHSKYDGKDERYERLLEEARAIVTEEIASLRRLVDTFRGLASLPRVEPSPVDLAQVVGEAAREVPFTSRAPAEKVVISADRQLLRRVIVNLVENAREAGAKEVVVAWHRAPDHACLLVDDDGPGVPSHLRDRLFDPYVTTKGQGTGLGLAIAKKTILDHGGEIALSSAASPLGGARFEIKLLVG
ncbi:MAG: HAMP domain-containing protein [Deltaproteobacteria bacterium]|nr:HAMP domain-containing protein [Deltaproteobacteria bacterium]